MGTARGAITGTSRYGWFSAVYPNTTSNRDPYNRLRRVGSLTGQANSFAVELFRENEDGGYYDPNDLSTLYQDIYGTVPVTGLSQPVGLMLDKRSPVPQFIVNDTELISNGDFSNGTTAWLTQDVTISVVSGELELYKTASATTALAYQNITTVPGRTYLITGNLRTGTSNAAQIRATIPSNLNVGTLFQVSGGSTTTGIFGFFVATQTTTTITLNLPTSQINVTGYFDNISVREVIANTGNHLFQSLPTARPTLEARVNRLIQSELFNGAAWTATNATVAQDILDVAAPNGTLTAATLTASANNGTVTQAYANPVSNSYTFSVWLRRRTGTGTVSIGAGSGSYSAVTLTNDWERYSVTQTVSTVGTVSAGIQIGTSGDAVDAWGAQLNLATGETIYQRVVSASNYDDVGAPRYLQFDGVDDFLRSGITPGIWSVTRGITLGIMAQRDGSTANGSEVLWGYYVTVNVQFTFGARPDGAGFAAYTYRGPGFSTTFSSITTVAGTPNIRQPFGAVVSLSGSPVYSNLLYPTLPASSERKVFLQFQPSESDAASMGNAPLFFGGIGYNPHRFYGAFVINRALTTDEMNQAYAILLRNIGRTS